MHAETLFESWRKIKNPQNSWGLAWYLAYEFCRRYYSSHGIVPHVIEKEGLGYYGIQLDCLPCPVNGRKKKETVGRLTISGDVENWRTGGPGDHGFEASVLCANQESTSRIVFGALRHMGLPHTPKHTHLACRHKRWGSSFELIFEIATIIALRNDDRIRIWNDPYHTRRLINENDKNAAMKEHPGAFIFSSNGKRKIVAGDGRILGQSDENLWVRYMRGESVNDLSLEIEHYLKNIEE